MEGISLVPVQRKMQLGEHRSSPRIPSAKGHAVAINIAKDKLESQECASSLPLPTIQTAIWHTQSKGRKDFLAKLVYACETDPDNGCPFFSPVKVRQTREMLIEKDLADMITHEEEVIIEKASGNLVVTDLFVRNDPKSFAIFDLRDKPQLVVQTDYGPICRQVWNDIFSRKIVIHGFDFKSDDPSKRCEIILNRMIDAIRRAEGFCKLPDEIIFSIAHYALAGMTQAFESPIIERLKKHAKIVQVNSDDKIEFSGSAGESPRSFIFWVQHDAIHVQGKMEVTVMRLSDIYAIQSLGKLRVTRHFSLALDTGKAHRFPEHYEILSTAGGRSNTF